MNVSLYDVWTWWKRWCNTFRKLAHLKVQEAQLSQRHRLTLRSIWEMAEMTFRRHWRSSGITQVDRAPWNSLGWVCCEWSTSLYYTACCYHLPKPRLWSWTISLLWPTRCRCSPAYSILITQVLFCLFQEILITLISVS